MEAMVYRKDLSPRVPAEEFLIVGDAVSIADDTQAVALLSPELFYPLVTEQEHTPLQFIQNQHVLSLRSVVFLRIIVL